MKQSGFLQSIAELIKPDLLAATVEQYLWDHIQRDMEDIQRILTRNVDDVLLAIHIIVNNILSKHNHGKQLACLCLNF